MEFPFQSYSIFLISYHTPVRWPAPPALGGALEDSVDVSRFSTCSSVCELSTIWCWCVLLCENLLVRGKWCILCMCVCVSAVYCAASALNVYTFVCHRKITHPHKRLLRLCDGAIVLCPCGLYELEKGNVSTNLPAFWVAWIASCLFRNRLPPHEKRLRKVPSAFRNGDNNTSRFILIMYTTTQTAHAPACGLRSLVQCAAAPKEKGRWDREWEN